MSLQDSSTIAADADILDGLGASAPDGEGKDRTTKDKVTTLPEDDKEEKPEIEEDKEEVKVEGTTDDEKEDTEEQPDEETLDSHAPITMKDLRAKYPEILKDFPQLRDIIFRDKAYGELFTSVEDARTAQLDSEAFSTIRDGVLKGDASSFFESIREADSKALDKLSLNLLPALHKISPDLHWKTVSPLLEDVARAMHAKGKRVETTDLGKDLMNAALYLSEFLWGDTSPVTNPIPRKAESGESEESKNLKQRESALEAKEFTNFHSSVSDEAFDSLKDLVLERGKNNRLKIDPDGVLTPFIKNTITDKIISEVNDKMKKDASYQRFMSSLWTKARKEGYSKEAKSRILSAYLERARQLVTPIRNRLIAEVSGSTSAGAQLKTSRAEATGGRREPGMSGKDGNSKVSLPESSKIDWSKTSDLDILEGKAVLRK
jgi:hypothetical protein